MTNFSLERMLKDEGITLTRVGRGRPVHLSKKCKRSGALLGGEAFGTRHLSRIFKLSGRRYC